MYVNINIYQLFFGGGTRSATQRDAGIVFINHGPFSQIFAMFAAAY